MFYPGRLDSLLMICVSSAVCTKKLLPSHSQSTQEEYRNYFRSVYVGEHVRGKKEEEWVWGGGGGGEE